jgi:hypothetical protein
MLKTSNSSVKCVYYANYKKSLHMEISITFLSSLFFLHA